MTDSIEDPDGVKQGVTGLVVDVEPPPPPDPEDEPDDEEGDVS